jgi:hypothetical protein
LWGSDIATAVIASAAKQSMPPQADRWIASAFAESYGGQVVASLLAMTARNFKPHNTRLPCRNASASIEL